MAEKEFTDKEISKIYKTIDGDDKKAIEIVASKVYDNLLGYKLMGMEVDTKTIAIASVDVCKDYINPEEHPMEFDTLTKLVIEDLLQNIKKIK